MLRYSGPAALLRYALATSHVMTEDAPVLQLKHRDDHGSERHTGRLAVETPDYLVPATPEGLVALPEAEAGLIV